MLPINRQMLFGSLLLLGLSLFSLVPPNDAFNYFFAAPLLLFASCWAYRRAWSFEGRYDQWRKDNKE